MTPAERAMLLRNTPATPGTSASASRPAPSALQAQTAATISQGYWAAKRTLPDGREVRYWEGQKNGRNTRAAGWYVRGLSGGWQDSATRISDAPFSAGEAGVELLPRVAAPFAPSHEVRVLDDTFDFTTQITGRERSGRSLRSMPQELQTKHFGELVAWSQSVDELIDLFEKNEQDVTKWRNAMGALSGTQIALGLLGGGLIVAGIVATGGLAAIPMAAGAIAVGVSSAVTGVAVGAARSVAEVGLENAQREGGVQSGRKVVAGKEMLKGSGALGAKEGVTRGLMAASHAGAASAVGAVAGGGGAAFTVYTGSRGLYKAAKVDVGAIWAQVNWNQALQNIISAEAFVEKHSKGFDPQFLVLVNHQLNKTREKLTQVAQEKWLHESRRMLKEM